MFQRAWQPMYRARLQCIERHSVAYAKANQNPPRGAGKFFWGGPGGLGAKRDLLAAGRLPRPMVRPKPPYFSVSVHLADLAQWNIGVTLVAPLVETR